MITSFTISLGIKHLIHKINKVARPNIIVTPHLKQVDDVLEIYPKFLIFHIQLIFPNTLGAIQNADTHTKLSE
jgi:hypothetical protein